MLSTGANARFCSVPKAQPGDRVAVLSPAFAAPAIAPEIHEQAMRRLADLTGLVPVEYPTTRCLGASAIERADDITAAFSDPEIRAIVSTVGGDDLVTVVPYIDAEIVAANPKPFLGYSDNTNLNNLLWRLGVPSYYGGATQVHLGPGSTVDDIHQASLRAALLDGGTLQLTEPGFSQDFGLDWNDPLALTEIGEFEPTETWHWDGPAKLAEGPTWGGCLEVIDQIALANRLPSNLDLERCILILETSEELPAASQVSRWVRGLGERGILEAISGVLLARAPASALGKPQPSPEEKAAYRLAQRSAVVEQVSKYNPDAVICVSVPFGHTRPQWIIPYGGTMRLDGINHTVSADYS